MYGIQWTYNIGNIFFHHMGVYFRGLEEEGIFDVIGVISLAFIFGTIIYYISIRIREMGFPKIISFIKLYHKHIEKGAILSGITLIALRLYFPIQYHYSYIQGRKIILPNSSSHI